MCGLSAIFGGTRLRERCEAMVVSQEHRGPDARGTYFDSSGEAALGHNRLSIIDLSESGRQPMSTPDGRYWMVFNGEIYNYRELRLELADYPYRSQTDTEVALAAYARWGPNCLDRFRGMFSLIIWDRDERRAFAARDRFGVKPLYYHYGADGSLCLSSEIRALHAARVPAEPDTTAWATYLACGAYDHSPRTFWKGIRSVPAGHLLTWQSERMSTAAWYDVADRTNGPCDERPEEETEAEYAELLEESVSLRFRSDVPVGINLSGGLDSAALLGLVQKVQGPGSDIQAFTFTTGDERYDETPWVKALLSRTRHPWVECRLRPDDVPHLAELVQLHQDEPYGGIPTLAYAKLFATAREAGVKVLLDGQGQDEQWAGYDYYAAATGDVSSKVKRSTALQGSKDPSTRPECLLPDFLALAEPPEFPVPYRDALRNMQYRDIRFTKLPRALRFNDRISMQSSTELREPFLDHRLVELALRQPAERKIKGQTHKWLLRKMVSELLPSKVVEAPKRPLQTPQREWLRGPLAVWADERIEEAIAACGDSWLNGQEVRAAWQRFQRGESDNSFYIWQWISVAWCALRMREPAAKARSA